MADELVVVMVVPDMTQYPFMGMLSQKLTEECFEEWSVAVVLMMIMTRRVIRALVVAWWSW